MDQCLRRTPATAGAYEAELCFGTQVEDYNPGQIITPATLQCRTIPFNYPADTVIWHADFGG